MTPLPTQIEPNLATLLSELAALAYFRVDADRNVVEMSPAMERLTGFAASEILGRSCLRLHRCEDCLGGCGVFDDGFVRDRCVRLHRADGSTVDVTKSGCLYFGADGEIAGALEVVRPVGRVPGSVTMDSEEARRIRAALEKTRYNRTAAARILDMSRTSLWRKMREYGI